ncbi:MAG: DUF937 domain-containing protein [Gammaproteobacteria bacterium]|nr:DUF937 domain-containing protein [Gammaproteobacteria bacterium]
MDLKQLATNIVMQKMGGNADQETAGAALDGLVSGNSSFDLGQIVNQFSGAGGNIAKKAQSWLADGDNDSISAQQVEAALGSDKVAEFADKLGIGREAASDSLSEILPKLIDKSSSGGKLLGSMQGSGGLAGLASKFLK